MSLISQLVLGLALSSLVAWAGYRREALSLSGAAGAVLVGTMIWGLGGWPWGVTLISFFVLSSLLSHYKAGAKAQVADKFAKGSRRDLGQALANGGAEGADRWVVDGDHQHVTMQGGGNNGRGGSGSAHAGSLLVSGC